MVAVFCRRYDTIGVGSDSLVRPLRCLAVMNRILAAVGVAVFTLTHHAHGQSLPGVFASESPASGPSPGVIVGAQGVTVRPQQPFTAIPHDPALPTRERRWYGWQTLATDGVAIGLSVLSLSTVETRNSSASSVFAVVSASTFLCGAPVVHFAHGHVGKGFGSLGLRLGLPVGGALIAAAIARPCGGDFGCLGESALGFLVGTGSAIAIDAAVLANEEVSRPRQGLVATPVVAAVPGQAWAGVRASF